MGDTEAMRQALERIADGQCRADDLRHCGCLLNVQIAKEALAALASTEAPEPEDHVRCDLPTCRICDALAPRRGNEYRKGGAWSGAIRSAPTPDAKAASLSTIDRPTT